MNRKRMRIVNLLTILMIAGMTSAHAQDKEVRKNIGSSIQILQKALNKHNYGLIESYIDDEFTGDLLQKIKKGMKIASIEAITTNTAIAM